MNSSVKVLIQNADNGMYLTQEGTWTPAAEDARDFYANPHAFELLKTGRYQGYRVVYFYEGTPRRRRRGGARKTDGEVFGF